MRWGKQMGNDARQRQRVVREFQVPGLLELIIQCK